METVPFLGRLVEASNDNIEEVPIADGSNIGPQFLRLAFVLRRAWIRTLHLRSLKVGTYNHGYSHMRTILMIGLGFLQIESRRHGSQYEGRSIPPEFSEILEIGHEVKNALVAIELEITTETRPQGPGMVYTKDDTVRYNTVPERFNATVLNVGLLEKPRDISMNHFMLANIRLTNL